MGTTDQVAALFILLLAGLLMFKCGIITPQVLGGLNKLLVNLALPCLTLMRLQEDISPQVLGDMGQIFLYAAAGMLLVCILGFVIFKRQSPDRKAVFINLTTFSNAGFMGYPVVAAAFGEDKVIYAVAYVMAFNFLSWTLGVWIYQKGQAPKLKQFLTPALLAVPVGIATSLLGIRFPQALGSAMNYLGSTTTPLSMLVVGARLASLNKEALMDPMLMLSSLLRLVVYPCVLWGLMSLTGCSLMVRQIVFLLCAMPSAAMSVVQAEIYHCDSALASRGVALSTGLSMATIPLMLLFV